MISKEIRDTYRVVIGLEVHAQLATQTKIFSADHNSFGSAPNTNVSVISLAHPGAMPKLNRKVVEFAIRMGLACESEISRFQYFDRKNYFYPDLPKGYQITQDKTPICKGGFVNVKLEDGRESRVQLNRIHLEEDAGKSIHLEGEKDSLIDLNRAGVPLIEIVTEPCIHSAEEAGAFLAEVRKLVRYLEICDGNMEEGSLRCDANVSVRLRGAVQLGKKVEIKNMNSIRNVQRAIDYEIERQIQLLEKGEAIVSETRLFDAAKWQTFGMRTKEELNDYRYFPDPDLSPLHVSDEWLDQIKAHMPALPRELYQKYLRDYQLPEYDAFVITDSKETALFFEEVCQHTTHFKAASNWVMGPLKQYLNESGKAIHELAITPKKLAEVIAMIDEGKLNFSVASQKLFPVLVTDASRSVAEIVQALNLVQHRDEGAIAGIIDQVIREFPLKVEEYQNGKKGIIAMFMGEVMKRSKGSADPKLANELLVKKLTKKV